MSFNLERLQADEAEALAYSEGFPGAARLYARIDDLQRALGVSVAAAHEAEIDRDLYHDALTEILRGVERGEMTANNCMMLAARVLP